MSLAREDPRAIYQRATMREKAAAWDALMRSTASDSDALLTAYEGLTEAVKSREADAGNIRVAMIHNGVTCLV